MSLHRFAERPAGLVLAAGLGTRLRPLTNGLAKPAVPFLGRPLIHFGLSLLYGGGIRDITVNLHHRPQSVRAAVQAWLPGDVRVHFSAEPEILGTGGAFRQAAAQLGRADCFVVVNGKIYFEQELGPVLDHHRKSGNLVTMVVIPHSGREPFNPVLLDSRQKVEGFALRHHLNDFSNSYIYTGLQVVSREVLERVPAGFSDTVKDIYPALIEDGRKVGAFVSNAFWCESSTPARYLENSLRVAARLRPSEPLYDPRLEVITGNGVQVAEDARLERSVLWDRVGLAAGCRIRNAIICDGCVLPAGSVLENVVVVSRDQQAELAPDRMQTVGDCLVWPLE